MRAKKDIIERNIAGEYILVPVGSAAIDIHGMISLSESGHLLWQRLSTDATEDELVSALLAEYDVDEATARADVSAFVEKLKTVGLLEPDGEE